MPFLHKPSANIYYQVEGDLTKLPVVCLVNGYLRSSDDFRFFGRKILDAGFSLIILDNRGAGKTMLLKDSFSIEDMGEDLINLFDHLHLKSEIALCGFSMGGVISQWVASRDRRITRLFLVATTPSQSFLDLRPWPMDAFEEKLTRYFSKKGRETQKLLIKGMAKDLFTRLSSEEYLRMAFAQRAAMSAFDFKTLDYGAILAKTHIIHGDEDEVIPMEAAHILQSKIPGSKLHVLSGIGHLPLVEAWPSLLEVMVGSFSSEKTSGPAF